MNQNNHLPESTRAAFADAIRLAESGTLPDALELLASARDDAQEKSAQGANNQIERHYLEHRMHILALGSDLKAFAGALSDIGRSGLFSAQRLHELMQVTGGVLKHGFGQPPRAAALGE